MELHDYQKYARDFVIENPVSCLMLEMGLGKSVTTLSALVCLLFDAFQIQRVLVVAPLRVARDVWPDELAKWPHLAGLRYSVAVGTAVERRTALQASADIHIINRENLCWLIHDSGIAWKWDMVVLDELSSFKSYHAKRVRSLLKVRPLIKRIVGLTGTPTSNGLIDLWAQYRVLDMGQRLGRFIGSYREAYFVPDKRNGAQVFSYKLRAGAEEAIHAKIAEVTISMRSTDYLRLPELLEREVTVRMAPDEKAMYEKLKSDLVLGLGGQTIDAANAAVLSGKLLQMANGAVYGDGGSVAHIHDRKLEALDDMIEAAAGKPVLVAYWFKHDLARIKARSSVVQLDSADSIKRWNRGEIPVAVMHPASAGHGLNLQVGGSTLIWFGLTWSLELYQQTNARLWRQGQKDTVVVHHLITRGTIDEQVIAALKRKEATQGALIDAVRASLR